MNWVENDTVWIATYWGSVNLSADDSADEVHVVPVECDTPEEAIQAIREMHDQHAVFRSLTRVKGIISKQ